MLIATARSDPRTTPDLRHMRSALHERLLEVLPLPRDDGDLIACAMRDGAVAPGKRLRPLLLLLAGQGLGATTARLIDPACAVEMVHTASLLLDDLPCMDDASQRRGRPTVHLRFGEDVAVLASVALLSQAFRLLAAAPGMSAHQRVAMVDVLSAAIGPQGLVQGQFRDLRPHAASPLAEDVAATNELKTGALFAAAFEMAAIAADASPGLRARLRECAEEIGQAFQLRDDLSDRAPGAVTGKDEDQDADKATLVALLGRRRARERMRAHAGRASACLRQLFPHDGTLAGMVEQIATPA